MTNNPSALVDLADTHEAQLSQEPPIFFMDDPHAPEIFATVCAGFAHHNGVATLTMASDRIDYGLSEPYPINRVVCARLTMSTAAAQDLAVSLFNFLANHGLAPDLKADAGAVQ